MWVYANVYINTFPLDELNTTLEIVFSTQIYLAMSGDCVHCVYFSSSHTDKLQAKLDWRMSRGRQERKAIHLSPSSELLFRQAGCLLISADV